MGQGVPAGLVLGPSTPWPGEMVVGLALHGVFGASLSFGPGTPQPGRASPQTGRTAFLEITSHRIATQGVWLGLQDPVRRRKGKSRDTDRKAEGQHPGLSVTETLQGLASHRECLGGLAGGLSTEFLGRVGTGPQCTL